MKYSIEEFINLCQQSSNSAYDLFKQLLLELDDPTSRKTSYQFLLQLRQTTQKLQPKNCHYQFLQQNILDENDNATSLTLLQFPSTFLPEAWSFTFYEGLVRYPAAEYQNKKNIELGCGIGWISIALALRYSSDSIVGLDINPKAIVCARLNLYLNGLNENGTEKILTDGNSLLSRVSFFESNLFSHFANEPILVDKIIGCIPQVLNPEPQVMESLIAESASDEYLHSLSNYFAKQGFIEDQFGLGLIASAVEQSIAILKSDGKLILNLGGRPGRSVLERLMQRRGFKVRRIWQTQVEQAADTEIDALVDIEKNTGHRFEFYMSSNSDTPIDARAASKYANAGGKIYHSVDVYEAVLLFPEQVKSIYQSIDQLDKIECKSGRQNEQHNKSICHGLRSAVDLTYENIEDAEERYSFLAFLAKSLQQTNHFPYEATAGLDFFREQLAEYFRYYLRVDVQQKQIVITPGRRQLIASLLTNYRPKLTLVTKSLLPLIESNFDSSEAEIIQTPARVEYLVALMEKLKPQLVITRLDCHEIQSSQLVAQMIESSIKNNVLLVIDLTDNIDLSSQPDIHGVYRYLSENELSQNVILMAGLVKNSVYQNYSLNITLTANQLIAKFLVDAAELTYSRTPVLKQLYYAQLLEELLFFQRTRSTSISQGKEVVKQSEFTLSLSDKAKSAFSHPAIIGNHLTFNQQTVRLDFGENELSAPAKLKEVLLESYLVRKSLVDEVSPEAPLQTLLSQRFNLPQTIYSKMVFGNGVAPIYSALLNLNKRQQQSLVIPSGSYGYFKAAALYKRLDVCILQTQEVNDFKITPEELNKCLLTRKGCWLFLNAPVVNPTGAIYTKNELSKLLSIAANNQVTVIMDCIFMGLEFDSQLSWNLSENLQRQNQTTSIHKQLKLIMIGGISKEFAAGGLRFGYAWSTSRNLINELQNEITHTPHFTLGYAVRKLIKAQLESHSGLHAHLIAQREKLSRRAQVLTNLLRSKGWKVIEPQGGLFLVAKPRQYIQENNLTDVDGGDQITEKLFIEKNLVINNSTWTGLPGYCRFVLSSSDKDFNGAIKRLTEF